MFQFETQISGVGVSRSATMRIGRTVCLDRMRSEPSGDTVMDHKNQRLAGNRRRGADGVIAISKGAA
jgi:hypothetical protein